MEYVNLFKGLHEANIQYLICGGLAVNIYGIPRMTADIDILVRFDEANVGKFEDAVEELCFASVIPIKLNTLLDEAMRQQMISQKNLIAYSYYNTRANFMNLDILIDVPIAFDLMWERRETRHVDNVPIHIVSLQDLIEMKRYANRNQDRQDILMLEKLQRIVND